MVCSICAKHNEQEGVNSDDYISNMLVEGAKIYLLSQQSVMNVKLRLPIMFYELNKIYLIHKKDGGIHDIVATMVAVKVVYGSKIFAVTPYD